MWSRLELPYPHKKDTKGNFYKKIDTMKNRSNIVALACAVMICVSCFMSGCANKKNENAQEEKPGRDTTVIRIGTLSQAISYYEKEDEVRGYEYEVSGEFAEKIGKKPVYTIGRDVNHLVELLKKDSIDLIAYPLPVKNELKKQVMYTEHTYETQQILVQRKPKVSAKKKKRKSSKQNVLRDVTQLSGKEVWVVKDSKFEERLNNLNEETGCGIKIKTADIGNDEEDLMEKVSTGEIDFSISDRLLAMANIHEFDNLDIEMPVSFEQRAAWAVRDTALLRKVNQWANDKTEQKKTAKLHKKYFPHLKTKNSSATRTRIAKIPEGPHVISVYDPYFIKFAEKIKWDWCWIAAVARQESKFNPNATSWMGAQGLMQLMPNTGRKIAGHNVDLYDPETSVEIACKYLNKISQSYTEVKDKEEKIKFTLASYNAGVGHIKDAQALAEKNGKNPNLWSEVEPYIRLKSNALYYNDPVVKHGYLHGSGVCKFVDEIFEYKTRYRNKVDKTNGK